MTMSTSTPYLSTAKVLCVEVGIVSCHPHNLVAASIIATPVVVSAGQTLIELVAECGGRMSERRCAMEVAQPLVLAVAELHGLRIVHRNLKPEHIICSLAGVTLVDLFEAGDMKKQNLNHRTGTKEYSAPEVLSKPREEDIFHQVWGWAAWMHGVHAAAATECRVHDAAFHCIFLHACFAC